jgi:hypothetical protein
VLGRKIRQGTKDLPIWIAGQRTRIDPCDVPKPSFLSKLSTFVDGSVRYKAAGQVIVWKEDDVGA